MQIQWPLINSQHSKWLDYIFVSLCLALVFGSVMSRALVSIGTIGLVIIALISNNPKQLFYRYLHNVFNLACLILFLSYAISGFWSDNLEMWRNDTVTKLGMVALPFAFAGFHFTTIKPFKQIMFCTNLILLGVITNSLYHYYADVKLAEQQYMIVTTKYGDHIRFSLFLVFVFVCNLYLLFERKFNIKERLAKIIVAASTIIIFIYLHYLSARTGLLCLYVALFVFAIIKLWYFKKGLALLAGCVLMMMPIMAYFVFPRFQQKVEYMQYEFSQFNKAEDHVQYTLSDNNRFLSYEAALISIKEYPFFGVGSGDIRPEMIRLYAQEFPTIPESGALRLPHIQFLATSMAIGIPLGMLTLLTMLIAPIVNRQKHKLYMGLLSLLLFLSFMIDAMLEVQFGILVILFFALLMQKFMNKPQENT